MALQNKNEDDGPAAIALFFRALFYLGFYALQYDGRPFGDKAKYLGEKGENSRSLSEEEILQVRRIKTALRRGARWSFWPCTCLIQAMTAKRILNQYNLPANLYLGLAQNDGEMKAHAWVKSGNTFVCGEKGHEDYTVTAIYCS